MTSVLITGTTGFVGSRVHEYLTMNTDWDITGVSRSAGAHVDITVNLIDRDAVTTLLDHRDFDIIIHTAAITKTDVCENNKEACYAANITATRNLADIFPSSKIVFLSTYAVYNKPEGNCDEQCPISPTNYYIGTKIEAEGIVRKLSDFIIFRPSVIFGYIRFNRESKNYFMQLIDNMKNKKVTKSPVDQYFNPVYVDVVAQLVHLSLKKGLKGIYNIGSNENISKFAFNQAVMKRFGFDHNLLEGIESKTLQVTRPINGTVSSLKIQRNLPYTIPPLSIMINTLYDSAQGYIGT